MSHHIASPSSALLLLSAHLSKNNVNECTKINIKYTNAPGCGACDGPALWQNACDREDRQHPRAGHALLPHDLPCSDVVSMCGHILRTETQHQSYNRAL